MPNYDVTRIAGNIGALNALNSMTKINRQLGVHQARLASGRRINTAEDDPAGLTIATKLQARSEGLKVALDNIGDAKNLLAVAESGLGRINDILVQMRNKAEAGASDTLGSEERSALVEQMKAYAAQIDDIAAQTKWNDTELIKGAFKDSSSALRFQTGADKLDATELYGLTDMRASNGATSLNLAQDAAVTLTAAEVAAGDPSNIISAVAGNPAATNANTTGLESGVYTVEINFGADGTAAKLSLKDSNGKKLFIDAGGAAGGPIDTEVTFNSATGPTVLDLGNGLTVTVADYNATPGVVTANVQVTKGGGLTLYDAVQGINIDKNSSAVQFAGFMDYIGSKLESVSTQLSMLGALNGRLTFKEDQVSAAQINVEGAYNRIMNANMAEEQVNASKFQILQQTSAAMLAQANAAPQFLLSLFR